MTDSETISVYNNQVENYSKLTDQDGPDPALSSFIEVIPAGGFVLDLGCGPANASAIMRQAGLQVDPVDGSEEMVLLANKKHQIGARVGNFSDIDQSSAYDGIWANFSLLHATKTDFPKHLSALHNALLSHGHLHLGMKLGEGSHRDRLGRYYSYYNEDELIGHLSKTGFSIVKTLYGEGKGLAGDISPWITILSQKNV